MSYNVAVETVVYSTSTGAPSSVFHVIMPFNAKEDADNYIRTYERHERPSSSVNILRTATRLY